MEHPNFAYRLKVTVCHNTDRKYHVPTFVSKYSKIQESLLFFILRVRTTSKLQTHKSKASAAISSATGLKEEKFTKTKNNTFG